jgi:hypothetical protein
MPGRMNLSKGLVLLAGAAFAVVAVGQTAAPAPKSRGELLYSTHCVACHTSQIHWREKKLATDWGRLTAQVRRWQANGGLNWTDDDITDVARYLNDLYYHYELPMKVVSSGRVSDAREATPAASKITTQDDARRAD